MVLGYILLQDLRFSFVSLLKELSALIPIDLVSVRANFLLTGMILKVAGYEIKNWDRK